MFRMHTSEQRKDYIYNPKTQARLKCKYFNNNNLKQEWLPALTTRSETTKSSWTNFSTTTGGIRQVNFVQISVRNCINNDNNEACNALIPRIPSKQDNSRPWGRGKERKLVRDAQSTTVISGRNAFYQNIVNAKNKYTTKLWSIKIKINYFQTPPRRRRANCKYFSTDHFWWSLVGRWFH